MRKLWKDWLTRPRRWKKPGRGSASREPKHRPLAVERIEDRLMLSAVVPLVDAQGGFIDIPNSGFVTTAGAHANAGETYGWLDSVTGTPVTDATPQGGGVPVQRPELERIGSEELAGTPSEGGMIDLTRARRDTIFGQSNQPLRWRTGMENLATSTPAGAEPAISSAAIQRLALPESSLSNEPVRASFYVPTLEHIDGSRGRSRAFELAIGFPATSARDEYFANTERFSSGNSFRDTLIGPPHSAEKTAETIPSEEPDQEAYPDRRQDDFNRLHTQGLGSEQEVEPGSAASADVGAAHHRAVFARMASTESDVLLPGVFLSKKRSVEVTSVLTIVAAGHYLTTRQPQRSDTHPRRMWLPRRRRPL